MHTFATCKVVLQEWNIAEVKVFSGKTLTDSVKVSPDKFVHLLVVFTFYVDDLVTIWFKRQFL